MHDEEEEYDVLFYSYCISMREARRLFNELNRQLTKKELIP